MTDAEDPDLSPGQSVRLPTQVDIFALPPPSPPFSSFRLPSNLEYSGRHDRVPGAGDLFSLPEEVTKAPGNRFEHLCGRGGVVSNGYAS